MVYMLTFGVYWWDPCYHIWQHHGSYAYVISTDHASGIDYFPATIAMSCPRKFAGFDSMVHPNTPLYPIPSQACGLYYLNLLEDIVIKQWGYTGIHISCYIIILYPIMAIQISCITVTQGLRPSTFCCQRVFSSSRFALHDSSAYTWHLEKFKAWLAKRHGKITPFLDKIHPQTKKTGTKIE